VVILSEFVMPRNLKEKSPGSAKRIRFVEEGWCSSPILPVPPLKKEGTSCTEDSIRPAELVEKMERLCESDRTRLMARQNEFVSVACPACDAFESVGAFVKLGVQFLECRLCETIYASPRPSLQLLHDHYAHSESYTFWAENIFPTSELVRREKIFKPRVDRLLEYCKKYDLELGTLVEVGSGFGTFCLEMQSRKIFERIVAVEPTPRLSQLCRDRGLEVIELPVEAVDPSSLAGNVIASFETIEHLFSPKDFILSCRNILRDGGLLFLSCPNMHGFDTSLLREKSKSVGGEHLNLFNPRSLSLLLEKCGFTILEVQTPGMLDAELVRKAVLAGEYDVTHQPLLRCVLIDEWHRLGAPFQNFLAKNQLSSHMMVVARRG
jgi:SAM-dependent methyltransferase